jgi:hypothetical protein
VVEVKLGASLAGKLSSLAASIWCSVVLADCNSLRRFLVLARPSIMRQIAIPALRATSTPPVEIKVVLVILMVISRSPNRTYTHSAMYYEG